MVSNGVFKNEPAIEIAPGGVPPERPPTRTRWIYLWNDGHRLRAHGG